MHATSKASWEPIRRGDIYCASACGGGCTHAAYLKAKADGEALAAKMGPDWEVEVWENLGWYYRVSRGNATVRCNTNHRNKTTYSASIDVQRRENGSVNMLQFYSTADNPLDALGFAIQDARSLISRISESLDKLLSY